jgi:hypothetical protein
VWDEQLIYHLPVEYDDPHASVGLGMLKLFFLLETSDKPVDPRVLTRTFRWNAEDASVQQDIQEFWSLVSDYSYLKLNPRLPDTRSRPLLLIPTRLCE